MLRASDCKTEAILKDYITAEKGWKGNCIHCAFNLGVMFHCRVERRTRNNQKTVKFTRSELAPAAGEKERVRHTSTQDVHTLYISVVCKVFTFQLWFSYSMQSPSP